MYVTSLAFEQEPELGEGNSPADITQLPLKEVLDAFFVSVSDFYEELNRQSSSTCYQEFEAQEREDIQKLRSIIGKHVYMRPDPIRKDEDGGVYREFVIE